MTTEGKEDNLIEIQSAHTNKAAFHYTKKEMIEDFKARFKVPDVISEEAEENLIYGMNVSLYTSKAKIKEGIAYTIDEDSLIIILPKEKKIKQVKIYLLKITDMSKGKVAGNFKSLKSDKLSKINGNCCLTIHYDNNFKFYNLIFKSERFSQLFSFGITRFLEKNILDQIKINNTDLLFLKKIWKEYDLNHQKFLKLDQFTKFLATINFKWKKKTYEQIFKEIDSKDEGKIKFKDFIAFYELIVTGDEFREVFQKYSSDPIKKYMSMRGLSDFMEKEQHIKLSQQDLLNLMRQFSKKTKKLTELMKNKNNSNKENIISNEDNIENLDGLDQNNRESLLNIYENHSFDNNYYTDLKSEQDLGVFSKDLKNAFTLNFREFVNMLMDKSFNGIFNQDYFSTYQNMNQPLYNYYIHSSHNTYLDGNQINSKSTIEMYYITLKNGCRLIELDCWDGRNGLPEEPIITHWHFPVGELNFKEVLKIIKEYSFKKSEFPVILSVENHCSPKAQMNMEKYFREVLGMENIYVLDPQDPPLIYPSPNDLKRKFIIKAKRKRIFGNFENKNFDFRFSDKKMSRGLFNSSSNNLQSNEKLNNVITILRESPKSSNYFPDDSRNKHDLNNIKIGSQNFNEENYNVNNEDNRQSLVIPSNGFMKNFKMVQCDQIIQEEDGYSKHDENSITSDIEENASTNIVRIINKKDTKFSLTSEIETNNTNLKNQKSSEENQEKINLNQNNCNIENNYKIEYNENFPNNLSDIDVLKNKEIIEADKEAKIDSLVAEVRDNPIISNKKNKSFRKSISSFDSSEIKERNEIKNSLPNTSHQLLKKLKAKINGDDEEIVNLNQPNFDNFSTNSKNNFIKTNNAPKYEAEISRIKEIKHIDDHKIGKPKIKTIDQLAIVVGMVGVKYKKEDFEDSQYLPWECISISEPDFEKYISNIHYKLKIIKFCQKSFLKIYPDIMRTNSSNHDPIQCWSAGVQIAALNLQKTDDDWVLINKIFFKINGGSKCGYILKPDILLSNNCEDVIKNMFLKPVYKIKIKILSGFHLNLCFPKGEKINGIFVEVSLRAPNHQGEKQTKILTTDCINNNFLHPIWESNSKQFEIYDPELSFFVIKIYSNKKQHVLARSVIPIKIMNLGYRVLDLYDNVCSKFDSSFLIVKTNKIFLN